MNTKNYFKEWIKKEPKKTNEKYLFIVKDQVLADAIHDVDACRAVFLANEDSETHFSVNSFIEFLGEDEQQYGKYATDLIYVLCHTTKNNEQMKENLKKLGLRYISGWMIFKKDDYEGKLNYEIDLSEAINGFFNRFEKKEERNFILDDFHQFNEKNQPCRPFDVKIRNHIIENYPMFICGATPYIYNNGYYSADGNGTKLKGIIESYLYDKFKTSNNIRAIYNLIMDTDSLRRTLDEVNQYPDSYICFEDCMLDAKTKETIKHSPSYYCLNQIPFKYSDIEKSNAGNEIEKFFDFVFSADDDRQMLLEYAGLCLTKDTSQQRFLVLCGLGGTGKSVMIRMIEKATGRANVSNVSMQELSKRFTTSLLCGALLNSCADLPIDALEDSSVIKKLLGEDYLFSERKGENGFMFKNYSKLLFSTNMLPQVISERTNGFYRRLLILRMDKMPEVPDVTLYSRLEQEIHYFIKLCVDALCGMYKRGLITVSENSQKAVKQMRKDSDVVQAWLDDNCIIGSDLKIDRKAASLDFENYCQDQERQSLSKNRLYEAIRSKGFAEVAVVGYMNFKGFTLKANYTNNYTKEQGKNTPNEFCNVSESEISQIPFL